MIITCTDCGKVYDDAQCWTLCPHPALHQPPPNPTPKPGGYTPPATARSYSPPHGGYPNKG